ncbi:MAG: hypothetical protein AB7P03_29820 [Kofleriaceae bacterium]
MTRSSTLAAILVFSLLAVAACKSSGSGAQDDVVDAPTLSEQWTSLIQRSWELPAGATDTYRCRRIEVAEDLYIVGFRALAPFGTHHTLVTVTDADAQLGDYDCSLQAIDSEMLYASGVGSDDLMTPEGVAIHVKAGQKLNLNLHLFNTSEETVTGESGILIDTIPADQVQQTADAIIAGKATFSLDAGIQEVHATCTVARDYQIFAVWPHMHQLATHQKVVLTPKAGGDPITLLDASYSFGEQKYYPKAPSVQVHAGDKIDVTCSYLNDTGAPVGSGDSSTEEMCFTGLFRYPAPANSNLYECIQP